MSDYTKSTNFAAKDALASGNAAKVVKGTEIDTEFNNIATAIATKADTTAVDLKANIASPTFTGNPTAPTPTAGDNDTSIATTAFVTTAVSNAVAAGFGFKNRIINGAFQVNQRAVSGTVTLASGAYGHDRWKAGSSGCTYTFATSNGLTTLTISSGSLQQVIEDVNVPDGTNTMVMSWTGTAQGKIGAGSYSASGVTASVTGGANLTVEFNTGTLTKVQLEKGSTATSFDYRPYGTELALCQRYYYRKTKEGANASFGMGYIYTTGSWRGTVSLPVTMRTAPTFTSDTVTNFGVQSSFGNITLSALAAIGQSTNEVWLDSTLVGATAGYSAALVNVAGTPWIALSAEL